MAVTPPPTDPYKDIRNEQERDKKREQAGDPEQTDDRNAPGGDEIRTETDGGAQRQPS